MKRVLRLATLCALLAAFPAAGEPAAEAWVRGAPLNLRAGPGIDNPALSSVAPGERLEVVASSGEWVRVRRADGTVGWLAASYVQRDAPPSARIAELENEAARLREEIAGAARAADAMRQQSDDAARAEDERHGELERVRRENDALRAGARWPEWITGALILATGMAFGAVLRGFSGRRRQARLKL